MASCLPPSGDDASGTGSAVDLVAVLLCAVVPPTRTYRWFAAVDRFAAPTLLHMSIGGLTDA